MEQRKRIGFNTLISLLLVITCAFMITGVAFSMGGAEEIIPNEPDEPEIAEMQETDDGEDVDSDDTAEAGDADTTANDPGEDDEDIVQSFIQIQAAFEPFAPFAAGLTSLTNITVRAGSGSRDPVAGDSIAGLLDPDTGYEFELNFGADGADNAMVFASHLDKIVIQEKDTDTDIKRTPTQAGSSPYAVRIPVSGLKPETEYKLIIDKSIADADGLIDRVITFTTDVSTAPPVNTDFAAVFCYPAAGTRTMAIERSIVIEFNQEVKRNTVEGTTNVVLETGSISGGGTDVPIDFSLDNARKVLTVKPKGNLSAGTDYVLTLTTGIQNNAGTEYLKQSTLTFRTKGFDVLSADSAVDSVTVTIKNNAADEQKNTRVRVEIRRDIGARLESGGTVVYIGEQSQNISGGATGIYVFSGIDYTTDLYNNEARGDTYIDVYVSDNQGRPLSDPLHIQI